MKTKNLFRMLLLAVAMVAGVNNVQAEDIWTGNATEGSFTITDKFANIDTSTKIQIYYKDLNIYYWALGITVDGNKNNTATLISNWKGESYGSQTSSNNNITDDGCIEFTLTDAGVEAVQNNGLQIIIEQGITVTKVSLVASGAPVIPKYTLTYVVDGNPVKTEHLAEGATPTPPADPTKEDYVFDGWENLPETMPAHDVTATAKFVIRKYTVTYTVDGEVVETVEYAPGETIADKAAPTKTGYTFSGWNGMPQDKIMPKYNVTISGTFSINHHSIVYKVDGNYYDGKYNIPYGTTLSPDYVPATNPTKEGYIFNGWTNLPETMPDEDLTIEASFVVDPNYVNPNLRTLTLVYDNTKGTVALSKSTDIMKNDQVTLTVTPAEGYVVESVTFVNSDGSTPNNWGTYTVQFGDYNITCTITFRLADVPTHTLSIVVNGQTTTKSVEEGADLSTVLTTPTLEGYTFTSWTGVPADGKMPASDLTVTAQFSINSYTVTFMVDGEQYGNSATYEYGETILPPEDPTKEGYSFIGWEGLTASMPAYNLTITAVFVKNTEKAVLSVGATGYATYCTTKPLRFSGTEAIKAYIAQSVDETTVTLVQVLGSVAEGTGLLLKGTANTTAQFAVVDEGTTYTSTENLLRGVSGTAYTSNSANEYVLVSKNGNARFAETSAMPAVVPVGKAYLEAPVSAGRELVIVFDDDNTTGITLTENAKADGNAIYNLRGQRVSNAKKGIYVIGGKKVIIK